MTEHIKQHLGQDPVLAQIMTHIELPLLEVQLHPYEALLKAIIYQQLSTKAADTIFGRFEALFGGILPSPELLIEMDHDLLRGVGVSHQKIGYLKNIAEYFSVATNFDRDWTHIPDETILAELTQIKGVGEWTVHMVLMFNLSRPDVFPTKDLGIKLGMQQLYQLDLPEKALLQRMTEIAERWKPYRSYGSRLVWKARDKKGVKG